MRRNPYASARDRGDGPSCGRDTSKNRPLDSAVVVSSLHIHLCPLLLLNFALETTGAPEPGAMSLQGEPSATPC